MSTILDVKRLRRQAKLIGRERGIQHSVALNSVAQEHGHPHWNALLREAVDQRVSSSPESDAAMFFAGMSAVEVREYLKGHFEEARAWGTIVMAVDDQDYAGDLCDAFTLDIADWLKEEFPGVDEMPGVDIDSLGAELEQDGPWALKEV